jgi:hypothetical protein
VVVVVEFPLLVVAVVVLVVVKVIMPLELEPPVVVVVLFGLTGSVGGPLLFGLTGSVGGPLLFGLTGSVGGALDELLDFWELAASNELEINTNENIRIKAIIKDGLFDSTVRELCN